MPTIPTRLVGLAYVRIGLNTVTPPHKRGPASGAFKSLGSGKAQAQWHRTCVAKPPRRPMIVPCASGQTWCEPDMHCAQCMQLLAVQPSPTRWPTFKPLAAGPSGANPSHDFVAKNGRIRRHAPIVVEHGDVGMAQAAMFDGDLHVLGPEGSEFDRLRDQFLLRPGSDPSSSAHVRSPKCCRHVAGVWPEESWKDEG